MISIFRSFRPELIETRAQRVSNRAGHALRGKGRATLISPLYTLSIRALPFWKLTCPRTAEVSAPKPFRVASMAENTAICVTKGVMTRS